MGNRFFETAFTPSVKAEQERHGSRSGYEKFAAKAANADFNGELGDSEIDFIGSRDSFYLGTVSETGWPHVQHRGGPPGFVRILDSRTLAWADFSGNRQYVSIGNTGVNDCVALFFMDYPSRQRLKVLGRMTTVEIQGNGHDAEGVAVPEYPATIEHLIRIRVEAFDWNCSQHITARYTSAEVETAVAPLRQQIEDLQARIARLTEGR
jgi:predicted pyridoxine 5'-phosphate oxidase superfamily flavin-nucleotide-binding protein